MKNPFVAMALAAAAMASWARAFKAATGGFAAPSHTRQRSKHRVAMDKRAATKARNVKRNKA